MKLYFLAALSLLLSFAVIAKSHKKAVKKASKVNFTLLEAYTQRTLPGMPRGAITTSEHFIIVWQKTTQVETVFWRGDGGFMPCNILKAHKIDKKNAGSVPPGLDYYTEPSNVSNVHRGDTIMLTPVTGGKFPIPKEIPVNAKNTIFYKTKGSGWLSFPVGTISKKRDIAMP